MKLELVTSEDIQEFYRFYLSNKYPEFFRHFADGLDIDRFKLMLLMYAGLQKVTENDELMAYVFTTLEFKTRSMIPGILIPIEKQSNGYAFKVMVYLLDFAFNKMNMNKVVCVVSDDDKRTNELLDKGKFTLDAVLTDNCCYSGLVRNENRWVMYNKDFNEMYKEEICHLP